MIDKKIECAEVLERIDEYWDKELEVLYSARIEEHLSECDECAKAYDEHRQMKALVRMAEMTPEHDLNREVMKRITERRRRMKYLMSFASVAAVFVIGIISLPYISGFVKNFNSPIDGTELPSVITVEKSESGVSATPPLYAGTENESEFYTYDPGYGPQSGDITTVNDTTAPDTEPLSDFDYCIECYAAEYSDTAMYVLFGEQINGIDAPGEPLDRYTREGCEIYVYDLSRAGDVSAILTESIDVYLREGVRLPELKEIDAVGIDTISAVNGCIVIINIR